MKQEGLPGGFLSHIFSKKPSSKQGKGFFCSLCVDGVAAFDCLAAREGRDFPQRKKGICRRQKGGWRCLTVCHLPADVSWPWRWKFPVCREEVLHGGHGHQTPISPSAACVRACDSYLHIYNSTDFTGN